VVVRNGKPQEIAAYQVVVGDILMLRPGSYVAADGRLVEVDRLSVDESTLTGESVPVNKSAEHLPTADLPLGDRFNPEFPFCLSDFNLLVDQTAFLIKVFGPVLVNGCCQPRRNGPV